MIIFTPLPYSLPLPKGEGWVGDALFRNSGWKRYKQMLRYYSWTLQYGFGKIYIMEQMSAKNIWRIARSLA